MRSREKLLLGMGILLIGGYFGVTALVMPAIDNVMKKQAQLTLVKMEVVTLDAQLAGLRQRIQQVRVLKELPDNVTIRRYEPNKLETSVKGMIDEVVQLATQSGISLTALQPWSAPPVNPPPTSGAHQNAATPANSQETPAEPQINVQSRGYELTLQGTYKPIHDFLSQLNEYPELIEINNVTFQLQDFSGGGSQVQSQAILHEDQPIRVVVRLVLYFQPQ